MIKEKANNQELQSIAQFAPIAPDSSTCSISAENETTLQQDPFIAKLEDCKTPGFLPAIKTPFKRKTDTWLLFSSKYSDKKGRGNAFKIVSRQINTELIDKIITSKTCEMAEVNAVIYIGDIQLKVLINIPMHMRYTVKEVVRYEGRIWRYHYQMWIWDEDPEELPSFEEEPLV